MRKDVKCFTRTCDTCQRVKYLNYRMEGSYEFLRADCPNDLASVDFFGPLLTDKIFICSAECIF